MKNALKKTLVGLAAGLALATGGLAASALTVDSSAPQASWHICDPSGQGAPGVPPCN